MPRLGPVARTALGYWWDLISGAVQRGFTTTETTQIAAGIAADFGEKVTWEESKSIAILYGYAKRMDNAAAVFQNAPMEATVVPQMVATPPWAREESEQAAYPQYHVKFFYTYIDTSSSDHEEQTGIRTSVISQPLPSTVGGIRAIVQADAQGFAAKYGHELVSAIPYSVLAV